jgi:predicted metal-dependent HD superfamily phosphohydrolase
MNFKKLAESITEGLPKQSTDAILSNLEGRYAEPWRHHHDGEHIEDLFGLLNRYRSHVKNPRVVGWAILKHDAIYDPRALPGRNEELSAQLAESVLPSILRASPVAKVARYTRATATHISHETDPDLDFFLDADVVILGTPQDRYDRYTRDIRQEYAYAPLNQYNPARLAILQGLSTRAESSGLFQTELFRSLYEVQAQENIARECDELQRVIDES